MNFSKNCSIFIKHVTDLTVCSKVSITYISPIIYIKGGKPAARVNI